MPTNTVDTATSKGPSTSLILAVFVATLLGLFASELYAQHVSSELDADAISVATNAAPAIVHLASARGEVLRLAMAAVAAIERSGDASPIERAEISSSLSRLKRELAAYRALSFYPNERSHAVEVDESIAELDARIARILGQAGDPERVNPVALSRELLQAAAHVDMSIEGVILFNAEQQRRLGLAIPKQRSKGVRIGYALLAATALLGLNAMFLVSRALRQYRKALKTSHRRVAERARGTAELNAKLETLTGSEMRILRSISDVGIEDKVLQTIAGEARSLVEAAFCAVGIGTDPGRLFDSWITSGEPTPAFEALARPPRPEGLLGAVVREARLIRLADFADHEAYEARSEAGAPTGSFLGVPIIRDGSNIANLYLTRKPGEAAFSAEDARIAELLAAYVSIALANSSLYTQALGAVHAREDLLASVSHDLKGPLSSIQIATGLLLRRHAEDPDATAIAQRIERSSGRMVSLIRELLEAAKVEAGAMSVARRPEDARSLVASAVELYQTTADARSITITAHVPVSVDVSCERHLILRVFANLIGNALKFSPDGSSVCLTATAREAYVQFSVADSGPGMSGEQLLHIFDRYWQARNGDQRGSGLGLYIAKGIIEAHGGSIWFESTPEQGTTAHFTLPVVDRAADGETPAEPTPADATP